MLLINLESYNRNSLSLDQQDFLTKIVPLSQLISNWIVGKCQFANKPTRHGIFPSIIMSEIILKSEWGSHPISKSEYNNKYSNNLTLLEADKFWNGKKQKFENKSYKAYKDWGSWSVDFSDYIVFSGEFDRTLKCTDVSSQIPQWGLTNSNSACYNREYSGLIDLTIDFYNLNQFN